MIFGGALLAQLRQLQMCAPMTSAQPDADFELTFRAAHVAQKLQRFGQVVTVVRIVGRQRHGTFVERPGALMLIGAHEDHAQDVECLGIQRRQRQCPVCHGYCLGRQIDDGKCFRELGQVVGACRMQFRGPMQIFQRLRHLLQFQRRQPREVVQLRMVGGLRQQSCRQIECLAPLSLVIRGTGLGIELGGICHQVPDLGGGELQ